MSESYVRESKLPVPVETLFAWHERVGAFERLNPSFDPVVIEERSGGLEVGARTVIRLKVGPVSQRWVAVHTAYEKNRLFRDEQESGPFTKWVHTHQFEPDGPDASIMRDEISYELPLGALGAAVGDRFARSTLERNFAYRHTVLRYDLTRHAKYAAQPRKVIALTGASGLIGAALKAFLTSGGHEVRVVKRAGNVPDPSALEGADAVVNLAGAGVADERWSAARKELLTDSRVQFTRTLVRALEKLKAPPKVWVQGSAIGLYGDRGDDVLTETSAPAPTGPTGAGFLAQLCADWETEGAKAEAFGLRVVMLRTGLVQSATGGALAKLLVPFKAGAGGPVGTGRQWQSWISLEDELGLLLHALFEEGVRGPLNAVGPEPVTNTVYGQMLGHVLSRPALMPLPAFAMRAVFGELADGALLASQRVLPALAQQTGFSFLHSTLESALRFTLGR
jgi:uncharacterized protein (TIGR01777 family)